VVVHALRVTRVSAANAYADLKEIYTWKTWLLGWLMRMLAQVTMFTLVGKLLGSPEQMRFLVVGNALMTCVVEAMMVVASSTWERDCGTLPLLLASPVSLTWVFVGRSLQWLVSGVGTSMVGLLVLAPVVGVTWQPAQIPALGLLVVLTATTSYSFGLALSAVVVTAPGSRNIVSNLSYLLMMAICGVDVPVTFWPPWVQAVASALPLTHALAAVRALAAGDGPAAVVAPSAVALALGGCWLLVANAGFRVVVRVTRISGRSDFAG
jgi:ABC-2 type transport system permease protein